jgi:hypothetical protein
MNTIGNRILDFAEQSPGRSRANIRRQLDLFRAVLRLILSILREAHNG